MPWRTGDRVRRWGAFAASSAAAHSGATPMMAVARLTREEVIAALAEYNADVPPAALRRPPLVPLDTLDASQNFIIICKRWKRIPLVPLPPGRSMRHEGIRVPILVASVSELLRRVGPVCAGGAAPPDPTARPAVVVANGPRLYVIGGLPHHLLRLKGLIESRHRSRALFLPISCPFRRGAPGRGTRRTQATT